MHPAFRAFEGPTVFIIHEDPALRVIHGRSGEGTLKEHVLVNVNSVVVSNQNTNATLHRSNSSNRSEAESEEDEDAIEARELNGDLAPPFKI